MGYVPNTDFLRIPSGEGAGGPVELMRWQRRFFRAALDPDGPDTILLSMPRGNAKTTTAALFLAYQLAAGPAEGQHYIVAPRIKQAGTLFSQMRRSLGLIEQPQAQDVPGGRFAVRRGSGEGGPTLRNLRTGAAVDVLAADALGLMGAIPHTMVMDEMAFFERPRDTYDALRQSLGKIRGAKLIATGTRPPETDNPFHGLLDDPEADTLALKWTYTGPRAGALTMRAARSCNPSLGRFPELARKVKAEAVRARKHPEGAEARAFMAYRLNMAVHVGGAAAVLTVEEWAAVEVQQRPTIRPGYTLGIDLAGGAGMVGAAAFDGQALAGFVGFPDDPSIEARDKADKARGWYERLKRDGDLFTWSGRGLDAEAILREAVRRWGYPARIVADRYRSRELIDAAERLDLEKPEIAASTFAAASSDLDGFRDRVRDGVAVHKCELWRRSLQYARTEAGKGPGGALEYLTRNSDRRQRNDLIAAAILAVARWKPGRVTVYDPADFLEVSPYE